MLLLLGSKSHTYVYYCWLCCGRVGFVVLFAADELEKLLAKEQILRQGLEIKVGILNKQYEEATRQVVELEHSLAATTTQLQQLQLHNASRTSSALQSQGRLRQQRQGAAISEEAASLRVITEAKSEAARIIAAAKDQAAITVTDALAAAEAVAARPPPDTPPRPQDQKFSSGSQDDQNAHNVAAAIPAAVRVRAGRTKREMWQEVEQKVEAAEQRCRADAAAQVAEQVSATQQQCARQVAEATAAKDEAVAQVASLIQRLNSEARFRSEGESTAQDLRAQLATMEVELREAKAAAAAPRPQTPERRKKGGGRFCSSRP